LAIGAEIHGKKERKYMAEFRPIKVRPKMPWKKTPSRKPVKAQRPVVIKPVTLADIQAALGRFKRIGQLPTWTLAQMDANPAHIDNKGKLYKKFRDMMLKRDLVPDQSRMFSRS
jgi:hypothetical protein